MSNRGKKRRARTGDLGSAHSSIVARERRVRQDRYDVEPAPYASFWQRLAAALVDWPIGFGIAWAFRRLGDALTLDWISEPIIGTDVIGWSTLGIYLSASMLLLWLYEALFISSRWQATPGKRMVGIAVTDLNEARISFLRATGRFFAVNFSSFMVFGYLIQPFTAKRQALHDLIAGTIVVQGKTGVANEATGFAPFQHDDSTAAPQRAGRKRR